MLKNSFLHIPGIGAKSERQLWDSGIIDWDCTTKDRQFKTSPKKLETITQFTQESIKHLIENDPEYFVDRLPAKEHWRIFPEFRSSTAYIDIETTGLNM